MTEKDWDKKLNIDTTGRDASKEDEYHYPYEPTPYSVLERLVESGYISQENIVIDYGCGKGRVGFFLNHQLNCSVIGIDFDERMYEAAQGNLRKFDSGLNLQAANMFDKQQEETYGIRFYRASAERYEIENADTFYFFNPFSVEVLQSVIGRIKKSYYENPREMQLFLYYPSDEYISCLMTVPELCFVDEIDCRDLFGGNDERERIIIFNTYI